ncbi:MAG: peptidase [Candidatus Aminicenantes bacterium RBG_13_59_9]|nr:MAG: peptidase [Candidatus Aminicenantes bacterium RBG_13_59_9]
MNRTHRHRGWPGRIFRFSLAVFSAFLLTAALVPQEAQGLLTAKDACTSIMVGRLASTDGSVMTAHTCDGNYRQWLNIVPHAKWPAGGTTKIYAGKMHTEFATDTRGLILKGEIPQVPETYAFLNTCYPSMNEAGLAIGETTIGGKDELENPEGIFYIEEIERIILERCRTAREAVKLAGELIKTYGYGDSGECITIADSKEVWHFEVFGQGPAKVGGVWAAVRIPDDHVGVSANIVRIGEINLKDPDHYMASDNVFQVAQDLELWDPKKGEPFKFYEAYGGSKNFSMREFFIFNTLAPSLKLDINAPEIPFSVKPENKLSLEEVLRMYRQTYEGTEYDKTRNLLIKNRNSAELEKSPVANPWMTADFINLINTLKPDTIDNRRTIAIAGCAYATVLQCRGWLPPGIGTVCWFAFDNPGQSARFPIFAGVTELPASFEVCAQHRFRMDSAAWAFRRANRLSTVRWGATRKIIEDTIKEFEDRALMELPMVEKKALELLNSKTPDKEPMTWQHYLTKYTNDFAKAAMQRYMELGDRFWAMFSRGF